MVYVRLRSLEALIMDRRFSSRDVALSEARAKQTPALPEPRPGGIRYDSFDAIYKVISPVISRWTYPAVGGSIIGTTVLMDIRDSKWKCECHPIGRHKN